MQELQQALQWAMTGNGRLVAAAALTVTMFALKSIGPIKRWLDVDGPWILSAARKKLLATALLTLAPVVALLADATVPTERVLTEAVTILLAGMGIHGGLSAARSSAWVMSTAAHPEPPPASAVVTRPTETELDVVLASGQPMAIEILPPAEGEKPKGEVQ